MMGEGEEPLPFGVLVSLFQRALACTRVVGVAGPRAYDHGHEER
jgi:hypothetical protein